MNPERVHLLEREGKLGLGTAYIAGFKWSLSHEYEYTIERTTIGLIGEVSITIPYY